MATESNEAVLFEGLFEQAKLYRDQRDALLAAAEAVLRVAQTGPAPTYLSTSEVYALRAAIQQAKGGAK